MAKIKLTFTEEQLALISAMATRSIKVEHPASTLGGAVRALKNAVSDETEDERDSYMANRIEKISEAVEKSEILAKMDEDRYYGIDTYDPFDGTDWETAVNLVSGRTGENIQKVTDDVEPYEVFSPETEEMREFIMSNIGYIEQLVHQMCNKGGLKPGVTYVCTDREGIWKEA